MGGYGSIGYRAPFSRLESEKLLLRTHTTSVSTAMLYKLANQPGGFKPAKLFSIDRVFRNEATDATHLAEFHQVEGVVADYDITLGHLIGKYTREERVTRTSRRRDVECRALTRNRSVVANRQAS